MAEATHEAADGTDAAELQPGTEVGGYVIDGKIGQGGMGVVYGARRAADERADGEHGARAGSRRRPAQEEPAEDLPLPVPVVRPGSLILVLETASSIEIDGSAVAQSSKGGRFEVAPGQHEIRVKAPGRQPVVPGSRSRPAVPR